MPSEKVTLTSSRNIKELSKLVLQNQSEIASYLLLVNNCVRSVKAQQCYIARDISKSVCVQKMRQYRNRDGPEIRIAVFETLCYIPRTFHVLGMSKNWR